MKKVIISILMVAVSATMVAQDAACSVGLQLGFSQNIYRVNSPTNDVAQQKTLNGTNLNGFKVGAVFEGNIVAGFGALISLNYTYGGGTTKWQKISDVSIYPQTRSRYDLHNLELACDWQYKFKLAQKFYFLLYSGPAIQCNLSLHETEFLKDFDQTTRSQTKVQHIGEYDDTEMFKSYRRLNVTWGVGIGVQYERYFIRGGYDFGLVNPYYISNFNQVVKADGTPLYASQATRGREDQWFIKLGIFLWQADK